MDYLEQKKREEKAKQKTIGQLAKQIDRTEKEIAKLYAQIEKKEKQLKEYKEELKGLL